MKYFEPHNFDSVVPAKLPLNFRTSGTSLGKKLTLEFNNFYQTYINAINTPQFQAINNPLFQRLDFKLSPDFRKELNYFLRTQVKQKNITDAHHASDKLFEAFTPVASILQDNERLFSLSLYWRRIFEFVDNWEKRNNYQVHKGTIFSFWALAELLAGDSEVGFMLMRNGLTEDERYNQLTGTTRKLTTPGSDFVRLELKTQNSYFKNIVKKMRKPLLKRILIYNSTFNYHLKFNTFRRQFSRNNSLEEASLYFNVTHIRIGRLKLMFGLNLGSSETARHILISSLFDLSKVSEVVARKSTIARSNARHFTIRTFLIHLVRHNGWTVDVGLLGDYVDRKFNGSVQDVEDIIKELLTRNMTIATNQNFPKIIYDCLLLYGLRNYGAHAIDKVPDIFTAEYKRIIQVSYNALFFIVENYQVV